jgi:hypothetical protein
MGKGGTVLEIIAILIGAGGLTFCLISWTSVQKINNLSNVLYSKNDGPYTINPAFTVLEVPNLNVSFDLSAPASVYLSFNCRASITAASGYSTAFFFFAIDGDLVNSPASRVGNYQGGSTNDYYSVSLQHLIESMVAGYHNVTVRVSSENTVNVLTYMTLYVQTFAP